MNIYIVHYLDYSQINTVGAFDSFDKAYNAIIETEDRNILPKIDKISSTEWEVYFAEDEENILANYIVEMLPLNKQLE